MSARDLGRVGLAVRFALGLAAALLIAQPVAAQAPSTRKAPPARTENRPATNSAASTAAPVSDEQQQRFAACLACHGEGGLSQTPLTPSLAGQHAFYAITQLYLFREGRRANVAMSAMAKGMPDADMQAFSDLIAKLPAPPVPSLAGLDTQRMAKGASLAAQHRCASCHGSDFRGGKQVARLAQQREDYLLMTLQEYQSGARLGYTTAMNETLTGLSPSDLADLAYFLSKVGARD